MSSSRSVKLELLRHGPPHNQLLSPLTDYIALCGNHPPATVRMPFEHSQLLNRLKVLRYGAGNQKSIREHHLQDMAQIVGHGVLGNIPGLIADLTDQRNADCQCDGEYFTQLRLIVSASELALIPYEIAIAPDGFPGAGQSLLLQSQSPLCMTREVRRVTHEPFRWPDKPKILFITATPKGQDVPYDAHLNALRKAVDPWTKNLDPKLNAAERLADHLVVLKDASINSIREACRQDRFSYIHILAHGANFKKADDDRFGLALHSEFGEPVDVVDGDRLAAALRTCPADGCAPDAQPAVVTIASCDGGNVGTVYGTGASVAHALHENGIPLVIASQFPLTFAGSVIMAELVYHDLLWGEDPRKTLFCLRRDLKARLPESHDWSSIVAYSALPHDFVDQLQDVRRRQAYGCTSAGYSIQDSIANLRKNGEKRTDLDHWEECVPARIAKGMKILEAMFEAVRQEKTNSNEQSRRLVGMLASAEKRRAEYEFARMIDGVELGKTPSSRKRHLMSLVEDPDRASQLAQVKKSLEKSREYYDQAFHKNQSNAWALVQSLVLTGVLDGRARVKGLEKVEGKVTLAETLSENERKHPDAQRKAWALGNLIELAILKLDAFSPSAKEKERLVERAREDLIKLKSERDNYIYTTSRQLKRYHKDYNGWFRDYQVASGREEPPFGEIAFKISKLNLAVKSLFDAAPSDVSWNDN